MLVELRFFPRAVRPTHSLQCGGTVAVMQRWPSRKKCTGPDGRVIRRRRQVTARKRVEDARIALQLRPLQRAQLADGPLALVNAAAIALQPGLGSVVDIAREEVAAEEAVLRVGVGDRPDR